MDALAKLKVVWEVNRNGSYILFYSVPTQMFTLKFLGEMKNYGLQGYNKDEHSASIFENVMISDILPLISDVLCFCIRVVNCETTMFFLLHILF